MQRNDNTKRLESLINISAHDEIIIERGMKLVKNGADCNIQNKQGLTLLHLMVAFNRDGVYDRDIETLVYLYGGDLNIEDNKKRTPLEYYIVRHGFDLKFVMKLMSFGVNANWQDNLGNTVLHQIAKGCHLYEKQKEIELICKAIEDLVILHDADLEIRNNHDKTPLECLYEKPFQLSFALTFIRLGADPNTKKDGLTLTNTLALINFRGDYTKIIRELAVRTEQYQIKLKKPSVQNCYLNFLIILACDSLNKPPCFYLNRLPLDLVLYIIKFFDFADMQKSETEGLALAQFMLSHSASIKDMLHIPGGINVFQERNPITHAPQFTLFKSATTLAKDYKKLKLTLKNEENKNDNLLTKKIKKLANRELSKTRLKMLEDFSQDAKKYAVVHLSLFKKITHRKNLFNKIKDEELYRDKEYLKTLSSLTK